MSINEQTTRAARALTPARRKSIYRVASAVVLVLTIQHAITADDATGYLQALALALGLVPTELAARNVPQA